MGETRLSSYDGRMLRESFALLAFALAAPVAAEPAEAPKLDLSVKAASCEGSADEVVVCGKRDERYRLDSAVMAVERSKEPSSGSRPPEYLSVNLQSCLPHGNGGCAGQGVVPVLKIAVVAAQVAARAIQGEDWREPLRTGPQDYRLYQESKARAEEPRPSVRLEFGVQPKVDTSGR